MTETAVDVTPAREDGPRPDPDDEQVPAVTPWQTRVRAALTGPWSIRSRLLTAVVSLCLITIVVVSAATYFALGSYLRDRLDRQLADDSHNVIRLVNQASGGLASPGPPIGDTAITLYNASRQAVLSYTAVQLPWQSAQPDGGSARTVTASNGAHYRVVVLPAHALDGTQVTIVYGLPVSQVDNVLHRLLLLELAVGGGAVVLLLVIGTVLVRVGLRPLDRIGVTAGKIAAGDLSRRVEPATERTEVGRLGLSLNAMLSQIEQEVAQRTASEERLRRFIADASHELRTPLTSIRGYAELFRRGARNRPEDLEIAMRRIEAEAGRMGGLVQDMLLLARLDEGRPLELASVDLAELARDAGSDARAVAPDRDVQVTVEGNAVVQGDDARLRQVLANLMRNVLAHTPAGTPCGLRVRGEPTDVVVEVWDRGPGLPPEAQARVFDRFWRGDPSRVRNSELSGSGLGLSIVAALVRAHGGTVQVGPTPGGGATFGVVLPRRSDPA
ncbi:MAG TPA: HAMP domain-containing sensor histidine kinase [Mycobacteriales bacterium]|jgi:two-component system OmpR family sensor kinase|nr:HAMP domain-containing sensor histidine kinase [Mycobacteriales bacterium]